MATYNESKKINKDTTSVPVALILGFSHLGNPTASIPSECNSDCLFFQNRPTIESIIDSEPESIKQIENFFLDELHGLGKYNASIDNYVKEQYWDALLPSKKLINIDFSLIKISQIIFKEQIDLDDDFKEALNELMLSKIGNKPTKKRF